MWMYEGPCDATRVHPEEFTVDVVARKINAITSARDNPRGARRVPPYEKNIQPAEVIPFSISRAINKLLSVFLDFDFVFSPILDFAAYDLQHACGQAIAGGRGE
jgi:hypothetical protein